jgi:hypothetical protein
MSSKRWEPATQCHIVTSQVTGNLDYTAAKTSKLAYFFIFLPSTGIKSAKCAAYFIFAGCLY